MLGAAMLAGGIAFVHRARAPFGILKFDGRHWYFESRRGRLQMCLDLQSIMLFRFVSNDLAARWLWIEKSLEVEGSEQWRAVRRAVYSRPSPVSDVGEADSANVSGGRSSLSR